MQPNNIDRLRARLFDYQDAHVESLIGALGNGSCVIDSSDTGTGKTYTAAMLCKILEKRPIVICPKPVVETWYNVLALFEVDPIFVVNYETVKNGKCYESLEEYKKEKRVNCEYIRVIHDLEKPDYEWVNVPEDAIIIFDEAHKGKNGLTLNSKLLTRAKRTFEQGAKILILSATVTDKIEHFRVAASLLGLCQHQKYAYRAWLRRLKPPAGETQIQAIHKIVYPRHGSRMRIRNICARPNNTLFKLNDIKAETYQMSPEVEQQITEAYQEIDEAVKAIKLKLSDSSCILTVILRARQRIEMLKVPTFVYLAMEYLLAEKSVVIFINFNDTMKKLIEALEDFVQSYIESFITVICGGQSIIERAQNVIDFTQNRSKLMISNIQAGGIGISLHDTLGNHPRVSLISPTWSSIDLKQVLGRVYRADMKSDCIQRIVYCKGQGAFNSDTKNSVCIEEIIAENVNKKLGTIEWLNNGDDEDLTLI